MKLNERSRFYSHLIAATTLFALLTSAKVHAVVIASWEVSGLSGYGPSPLTPATSITNTTVVGLTRGSGVDLGGTAAGNAWGGRAWDFNTDTGDFATFSVKANTGFQLSLSGFDAYNIRRSGTGPTSGQWQYSLNGTSFTNIGSAITWGTNTTSTGNAQAAINLSSIAGLQNVPDSTTVTFRILNFSGASTGTWYVNNIGAGNDLILNGTIVPVTTAGDIDVGTGSVLFPKRIVGDAATQAVTLTEVGGVDASYTSSTSGDAMVAAGGSGSIKASQSGSVTVGINTAAAGAKSGSVTIDDGNADVDQIAVSGDVYDHSSAAFLANGGTSLSVDLGSFAQGSGVHSIVKSIYNKLQTAGFTAGLDFDSILGTGNTAALSTDLTNNEFSALAASDANSSPISNDFSINFDTNNAPGTYNAEYQLKLSDADAYLGAALPGTQTLTLSLTGTVSGIVGPPLPGDYNGNNVVDASDYVLWRKSLADGTPLPNNESVTPGITGPEDYDVWRANFGAVGPGSGAGLSGSGTAVPEPSAITLLLVSVIPFSTSVLAHRRRPSRITRFAT